jgi:sortase A
MQRKKTARGVVAIVSGFMGIAMIGYVLFPLISYEVTSPRFASYLTPIPPTQVSANDSKNNVDYTKASNWFDGGNTANFSSPAVYYYTISIPKLGIKKATVAIGGEDLSQSLIQYPGTAVPGKFGNAVIFGHSILPQFYDPKRYITIFSTLQNLAKGDEIDIQYDGISYTFRVEDEFEVLPTDIQILQQDLSDSFLTLVTCTPPGNPFRPKRLIIRARIVPLDNERLRN